MDLTTLDAAKQWLGLDPNDAGDDELLTALVTAASSFFYQMTSRRILLATDPANPITVYRDGWSGLQRLCMSETPIVSVASLTLGTTTIPVSADALSAGYGFDSDSIFLRGWCTPQGIQNIKVTYSAGYDPAGSEALTIAQAVNELVAQKYKRRSHIDQNSQSLQGNITASYSQRDVPPEVQTVINKFARVRVYG